MLGVRHRRGTKAAALRLSASCMSRLAAMLAASGGGTGVTLEGRGPDLDPVRDEDGKSKGWPCSDERRLFDDDGWWLAGSYGFASQASVLEDPPSE